MKRLLLLLLVSVGLLAVPSSASAATFTVNDVLDASDDDLGDGVCEAAGVCTLRAAIEQADETPNTNDTIKFSKSVFDGTAGTSTITLTVGTLGVNTEMTINGGNCATSGTAKPCVGIDADGIDGIVVNADGVDIRGLAVFGADTGDANDVGIFIDDDQATIKGSWFGIDLNGDPVPNEWNVILSDDSGSATVGGTTGADRNVFGNAGDAALVISGSDDNRIRGNYFGVKADGTTPAPNTNFNIQAMEQAGDKAEGNVIGKTVSSTAASTPTCDKGCNVIANSGGDGIDLGSADGGTTGTTIKGNFIGLDKTGATPAENASTGIDVNEADQTVVGGSSSRDRNYITGGVSGIFELTPTVGGLEVKRNFFGLRSTGTMEVDPPSTAILLRSGAPGTDLASRNRITSTGAGISVSSSGARVVRNKIGVGMGGADVSGGFQGVRVTGAGNTIGEPEAGNTIGNTTGIGIGIEGLSGDPQGDNNVVQGNLVGVDSDGVSRPNGGVGIRIQHNFGSANNNKIGGTSSATENVISNSGNDAIRIQAGPDPGDVVTGNQIKRNRGKGNLGLFIDLEGDSGFGNNDADVQGGIEAPEIDNDVPGDTTRSHTQGTCVAGATIYVFRTSSPMAFSPDRINAFVKTTTCKVDSTFSTNFSKIPSGQRLTALQLGPTDGSSELALAVDPTIENP